MKNKTVKSALLSQTFTVPGLNRYPYNFSRVGSFTPSLLYPVAQIRMVPRMKVDLSIQAIYRILTAAAPVLNNYRVRVSAFFIPYRLYVREMRMNETDPAQDFSDAKLPAVVIPTTFPEGNTKPSSGQAIAPRMVAPGSLLNCLGCPVGYTALRTGGVPTETYWPYPATPETINGFGLLEYWDIYRNYFMNVAAERTMFVRVGSIKREVKKDGQPWQSSSLFTMQNKTFEERFLGLVRNFDEIGNNRRFKLQDLYGPAVDDMAFMSCRNAGLFAKSLPFDIVNARIENTRYANAVARSLVSISDGKLNMQDLVDGRRLYNYFLKAAYTVRFDQWIKAEYGIDISKHLDIPLLLRTWSFDIGFSALYGTASTDVGVGSNYLGSQVGVSSGSAGRWRLKYTAQEYGDIMFILSVEPDIVYTKTLDPHLEKLYFSDLFTPSFDRMGAQGVPQSRVNALRRMVGVPGFSYAGSSYYSSKNFPVGYVTGSGNVEERNIGYQPSWSEYVYPYSSAIGDIADPSSSLRLWLSSPCYGDGPIPYFVDDVSSDVTSSYDLPLSIPTDYLSQFPETTAGSQPFLIGLNFGGSLYAPISSNQIDKL